MYSVFLKLDIHIIMSTERYRYIERVFLSRCTNILDIHGNFSELLDLLKTEILQSQKGGQCLLD